MTDGLPPYHPKQAERGIGKERFFRLLRKRKINSLQNDKS
jgi:hypothetical protein